MGTVKQLFLPLEFNEFIDRRQAISIRNSKMGDDKKEQLKILHAAFDLNRYLKCKVVKDAHMFGNRVNLSLLRTKSTHYITKYSERFYNMPNDLLDSVIFSILNAYNSTYNDETKLRAFFKSDYVEIRNHGDKSYIPFMNKDAYVNAFGIHNLEFDRTIFDVGYSEAYSAEIRSMGLIYYHNYDQFVLKVNYYSDEFSYVTDGYTEGLGIDVGVDTFLALSTGEEFSNISQTELFSHLNDEMTKLYDGLTECDNEDSISYYGNDKIIARKELLKKLLGRNAVRRLCYQKLYIENIVNKLCVRRPTFISIEDLGNFTGNGSDPYMKSLDVSYFITRLISKCYEYGIRLYKNPITLNTSHVCFKCGGEIKMHGREGVCNKCDSVINRDINAAKNLYNSAEQYEVEGDKTYLIVNASSQFKARA